MANPGRDSPISMEGPNPPAMPLFPLAIREIQEEDELMDVLEEYPLLRFFFPSYLCNTYYVDIS